MQNKKHGREFEFIESVKVMRKDEFMKKLENIADTIYDSSHKKKKSKSMDVLEEEKSVFSKLLSKEVI